MDYKSPNANYLDEIIEDSNGTVTYNPVGEQRADTSETIPKKDGKEIDQRFKEQSVEVIDVTPKKYISPQQ